MLHEDWHFNNKKWFDGRLDSTLEEGGATFIGLFGAVEFARKKYGDDSKVYRDATIARDKWVAFSLENNKAFRRLSDVSIEKKLRFKEEYLMDKGGRFSNNSQIANNYWYTKHNQSLVAIYRKVNNLSRMADILRSMPTDDHDAQEYFNSLLRE